MDLLQIHQGHTILSSQIFDESNNFITNLLLI